MENGMKKNCPMSECSFVRGVNSYFSLPPFICPILSSQKRLKLEGGHLELCLHTFISRAVCRVLA